jgi:hypothetical protein
MALGPVAELVLLLAATFGGCAVIHHFLVRRMGRFGLLLGYTGPAPRPKGSAPDNLAAVERQPS